MAAQKNVYGESLLECSQEPLTGYYRDGSCNTDSSDMGSHTVCVNVTDKFLAFSKQQGNDLSTPRPEFGFAGLKQGDRWCVCAQRWKEAHEEGAAPKVLLLSTNERVLDIIPLEVLKEHAIDLS